MLALAFSAAIAGIDAHVVRVETDSAAGIPHFAIVGLPDRALNESRERIRAAIVNSGFGFPPGRLLVNLAPAGMRRSIQFRSAWPKLNAKLLKLNAVRARGPHEGLRRAAASQPRISWGDRRGACRGSADPVRPHLPMDRLPAARRHPRGVVLRLLCQRRERRRNLDDHLG